MIKNLKKLISTVAAVAMLASTASAFAVTFPDVDESASYANAVSTLTALGVVDGDDNGLFNPENSVTRAEFAKMVVEALGEGDGVNSSYTKFADTQGHWGAGYVELGVANGFINGYDENSFGPDDKVTYAQAVKMLVAALNYGTYAEHAGGWPSGYLSYGSSLNIINGVSVASNDTELTRAQCAVLINNAMRAPLCVIDSYDVNYVTGEYIPKYVVMDGEGKGWQSMLTKYNDAYLVKGRVTATSKSDSTSTVETGMVAFNVEAADNFDGAFVNSTDNYPEKNIDVYVADTNAEDLLFTYAEAIIQKDADSGDWKFVSIEAYGQSKTVEFAAKDVESSSAAEIKVYKSETSTNTTTYNLCTTVDAEAQLYVNGVKVDGGLTTDDLRNFLLSENNKSGVVTLVDSTKTASTSVDGKYDYVMVTCYATDVVDSVSVKNDTVKISFEDTTSAMGNKWSFDLEDEDVEVKFVKDGEEISYEDLAEGDVLTVAYDVNGDFEDSKFYNVYVSSAKATGVVTGMSTKNNTVTIDGTVYDVLGDLDDHEFEYKTEYTVYIDVFGNVVYQEEGTSTKNIGVVVAMYKSKGNSYHTVRLINTDGEIVTYEAKDDDAALAIYNKVMGTSEDAIDSNDEIEKSDVAGNVDRAIIEYTLSNGKIQLKDTDATVQTVDNEEYKESTSKLGSYTISETATKILDLESYFGTSATVGVLSVADLQEDVDYVAYVYDKSNSTGAYNFVVLTSGVNTVRANGTLAVVTEVVGEMEVDGTTCVAYTVAVNGEEDIEVIVEGDDDHAVAEGTVFTYAVGSKGYVEAENFEVIFTPATTYENMFSGVTPKLTSNIAGGNIVSNDDGGYTIGLTSNDKVEVFFGPVFQATAKSLELFNGITTGTSNVNSQTESLSLAGANAYTYDYSNKADKGVRVSAGASAQNRSIFKNTYAADSNDAEVEWTKVSTEEVTPMFAFVRVVDNDVTDVIYFIAD